MAFEKAQLAAGRKEPLAWLQNVTTRWGSDEAMFSHASLLQDAIKQIFHDLEGTWGQSCGNVADRPPVLNERLTSQEWKVVGILQKLLQPFKIVSKQLQGRGIVSSARSTCGGLTEYFPAIENLLDHLELAMGGEIVEDDTGASGREDRESALQDRSATVAYQSLVLFPCLYRDEPMAASGASWTAMPSHSEKKMF
jgi:hypothetical protein